MLLTRRTPLAASVVACAAVLALVFAFAVAASPAAAAVKRGTFAGTTSAGDPIGFKVDRRSRVVAFYYDAVTLECTDGDSFDTPTGADRIQTPRSERFRIRTNRFGITATNRTTGFGWDATGTFRSRGRRATGTLTISQTFNENNQQDPNGSIRCESGPLKWTVRRG